MSNKFIFVINSKFATASQRDSLTSFFEGKGWHVWHWFEDVWLLNSGSEELLAHDLGPQITKIIQGKNGYKNGFMLFGFNGAIDMAAYLNETSIPWIDKHFKATGEQDLRIEHSPKRPR